MVELDVEHFQTGVELVGELAAGGLERCDQRFGAAIEQLFEFAAGLRGTLLQGGGADFHELGECLARGRDAGGDFLAGRRQLFLELLVGAGDGGADALGVADDRIALAAEFLDQAAHAHFVVGIAALERIDLGMDQGLQFGSASYRALDALVHGRDFAADGLADGQDAVAGNVFRFGKAERDLGHRPGGGAHFAGAGHHDREREEDQDRNYNADQEADGRRHRQQVGHRADLPDRGRVEQVGQPDAANRPQGRQNRRIAQRAAARTAFERAQQPGHVLAAVVIGGRHRARRRERRRRHSRRGAFAGGGLLRNGRCPRRRACVLEFAGGAGNLVLQLVQRNIVEHTEAVFAQVDLQGVFKRLESLLFNGLVRWCLTHATQASLLRTGFAHVPRHFRTPGAPDQARSGHATGSGKQLSGPLNSQFSGTHGANSQMKPVRWHLHPLVFNDCLSQKEP